VNILVCGGILSVEDRMLAFTPSPAVTLAALALAALVGAAAPSHAAGSVAVADLSSTPQPALAEALRKGPGVKGRAVPAAQTAAVVEDAKDLGLSCKVSDDACLEKLHVLLRTDELLAFSLERGTIKLARVVAGKPIARAKVKFAAPATSARAVLLALDAPSTDTSETAAESPSAAPSEPVAAEPAKDVVAGAPGDEGAPPDEGGGFSPMLIVGVVGGVVTAGCAAGALGTSAHLAALEASGSIVGTDHSQAEAAFAALSICAAAGVVATGVGFGLFALEEEDAPARAPARAASASGR
jgi:hypothetical protein